ncbi:radical SAM protein [Candidatus Omnitrophota bacterium]
MVNVDAVKRYVKGRFKGFGVNKRQEFERLIYEIAKREGVAPDAVMRGFQGEFPEFPRIKRYLIKRRFPGAFLEAGSVRPHLPELSIAERYKARIRRPIFSPKNIYVEEKESGSALAGRFKDAFPKARIITIPSIKVYIRGKRYTLSDYNKRRDNVFIVRQRCDFFKRCPCTRKASPCGYHIFNLGIGCIYECVYCYLQEYNNAPGIIIPANIEDFFKDFSRYRQNIRLGTGEFTDSLALDHITEFSPQIVKFFKKFPGSTFEFKTKSANVDNLISAGPSRNVVVAWSLNPQKIIDRNEFYTASLKERLAAASRCVEAGFRVAFHFDPIIYYKGWQEDCRQVVDLLFDSVGKGHIAWISLGTLRFSRGLKKVIENRFPSNTILDGELLPGFDGKMRYSREARYTVYGDMIRWIRARSKRVFVYLCMEKGNSKKIAL